MIKWIKFLGEKIFFSLMMAAMITACNQSDDTSADNSVENATDTSAVGGQDWVPLFNGKTFAGWHVYGMDSVGKAWKIEDSVIHLTALEKNRWQTAGGGDLVTENEFSNFDLKLEWKISEAGNSGIFFYVHEDINRFKNPNESGLEMQINVDANNKNGKIEMQKAGDLAGLLSSSSAKVVKPAGQWNQVEIRSNRGKLDFFINGQSVLSTTLWDDNWEDLIENSKFKKMDDYGTYKKGRIALQDHGADVWFRNIMIKKL
ncbi:MAG TPA: DUF1080 domain-containing protein [Segetibacter sp.]